MNATKISQIIDTLNDNDKQYHYDYQQGRKYLKIYYSMILSDGTIRENNKSILYFYEPEQDLLYKAKSWKQIGNVLMSGKEFLTRNTYPIVIDTEPKQETETMNTTETKTEQPKEINLEQDLLEIKVKITKRERLLDYLKQQGINGKIQEATQQEIKELKEKLEKHEQELIQERIKNTQNWICDETRKILDALNNNDCETIDNCLKEIAFLNNELKQDLNKLAEAEIKEVIKSDFNEQDFIETKTAELVLTAPPTIDPQNVIELFPKKN